jgi:predicted alpha/beta superfamily hydrolase
MQRIVNIILALFFPAAMSYGYTVDTLHIRSDILHEERTILLFTGDREGPSDSVVIIYMLDGEWSESRFRQLVQNSSSHTWIGIGIVNNNRRADLLEINKADSFLRFIQYELLPEMEKNRRIQFRVLYGHSLAGGFTLYAMLKAPGLFNAYLASSPTPIMNKVDISLYQRLDSALVKPIQFYFSYGSRDIRQVKKWAELLDINLATVSLKYIIWKNEVIQAADHNSSAGIAIVHGTRW